MTVQIEFSYLLGLMATIVGAFWALGKVMLAQSQRHIEGQFKAIEGQFKLIADRLTSQDDAARRIERDLMDLKAELPRDYVRREDHNRVVASIHVSIDNLRLTIERFMLEGRQQRGGHHDR